MEYGHDTHIPKAKRRGSLTVLNGRLLQAVQSILTERAVLTDPFDFEELAVDLLAAVSKMFEVFSVSDK